MKQQMKDTKSQKKETTTSKKTSESTVDKTKSKSDASVSQDNKSSKTQGTNKSASQTSISHFSSVSTPEYREGWDRIFGAKGSKIGSASKLKRKDLELDLLSIPVEDMDSKTQDFLHTLFKKYAKRQGIQTEVVDNLIGGSYSIECRKNKKT